MKPEEKLQIAELVIKNVSECLGCESCKVLAQEYFSNTDYVAQVRKENAGGDIEY